jgi:hypothetical protein
MNRLNKLNRKRLRKLFFKTFLIKNKYVLLATLVYIIHSITFTPPTPQEISYNYIYNDSTKVIKLVKTVKKTQFANKRKAEKELIAEVDSYIKSVAPKSKVKGKYIVHNCLKNNIDIKFVLAQGHIESHFGTKGTAHQTHSIFNIGAYDGMSSNKMISKGFRYKNPNHSIKPYIKTLKDNYLVNGKTTKDLLKNYVNKNGKRYATDKHYENNLKTLYNNIKENTDIDTKINQIKNYYS